MTIENEINSEPDWLTNWKSDPANTAANPEPEEPPEPDTDWLKAAGLKHPPGPGHAKPRGFWKPGQSGNPNGRPKGAKNKRSLLALEMEKEGSAIARVVINAALAGDMHAANIVLQRLEPPLRPQSPRVRFELDSDAPLLQQAKQVLRAVADGEIDPDTGKLLLDSIHAFAKLKEADEIMQRLEVLEVKFQRDSAAEIIDHVVEC